MRRLRQLLSWQAQFDAKRPYVWLAGAAFVLAVGLIVLPVLAFSRARMNVPITGGAFLTAIVVASGIWTCGWISQIGSRAADERTTGFLALVCMTDVGVVPWTLFRILALLIGFLPLWVLRWPFYVIAYHFGGVTLGDIATAEGLLAVVALFVIGVTLGVAPFVRSSQTAQTAIGGILIGSQALFYVPRVLTGALRLAFGAQSPLVASLSEAVLSFSQFGLAPHLVNRPRAAVDWAGVTPALWIHSLVALVGLALATWKTFHHVLPEDLPGRRAAARRVSRRVQGDAIEWQAMHVHHNIDSGRLWSTVFNLLLLVAIIVGMWTLPSFGAGFLAMAVSFRSLMAAAMRSAVCIGYEIRDQTLSTLALIPRDPLEIYRGWRRGGLWMSWQDYILAAVAAVVMVLSMGRPAAGFLGVMFGMLLAAPFGVLNALVRFEWAVFWLAAKMFPVGIGCVVASIWLGAAVDPWFGLALFVMLALPMHAWIASQIPFYFQRTIERGP